METKKSKVNTVTSKHTQTNIAVSRPIRIAHGKFKGLAKFVAIIDIVLGLVTICVLLASIACIHIKGCYERRYSDKANIATYIVVTSVIGCIFATLEVYVAIGLFNATKPNCSRCHAIDKANCWRSFTLVFLFYCLNWGLLAVSISQMSVISSIESGVTNLIFFILRLMFLFVITGFIDELQGCRGSQGMAA